MMDAQSRTDNEVTSFPNLTDLTPTQSRLHHMIYRLSSSHCISDHTMMEQHLTDVACRCMCEVRRLYQPTRETESTEGDLFRACMKLKSHLMWTRMQTLAVQYDAARGSDSVSDFGCTQRAAAIVAQVICTSNIWYFGEAQKVGVATTLSVWYQQEFDGGWADSSGGPVDKAQ
jgi:hypothetical protein